MRFVQAAITLCGTELFVWSCRCIFWLKCVLSLPTVHSLLRLHLSGADFTQYTVLGICDTCLVCNCAYVIDLRVYYQDVLTSCNWLQSINNAQLLSPFLVIVLLRVVCVFAR